MNQACKSIYTTGLAKSMQLNKSGQNQQTNGVPPLKDKFVRMKALIRSLLLIFMFCFSFNGIQKNTANRPEFWKWAATPPMGWNSWDCYGPTVTEDEVKANVDYMADKLKDSGWEYVVVDIRWYVENDKAHGYNEQDPVFTLDKYGRFQPAVKRFPSSANGAGFKPLADYIHKKGLKFGVHIMRGIPKEAVKKNTPIMGTKVFAKDIFSTDTLCKWLGDMYTVDASKKGAQEYYNSLFKLYASWGVDYITKVSQVLSC